LPSTTKEGIPVSPPPITAQPYLLSTRYSCLWSLSVGTRKALPYASSSSIWRRRRRRRKRRKISSAVLL